LFALEAYVLKIAGIPQGIEVAFETGCVVNVTGFGKDSSADGFGRNATVSVHFDFTDNVLLPHAQTAQQNQPRRRPNHKFGDTTPTTSE